jgi:hypothetical protein
VVTQPLQTAARFLQYTKNRLKSQHTADKPKILLYASFAQNQESALTLPDKTVSTPDTAPNPVITHKTGFYEQLSNIALPFSWVDRI